MIDPDRESDNDEVYQDQDGCTHDDGIVGEPPIQTIQIYGCLVQWQNVSLQNLRQRFDSSNSRLQKGYIMEMYGGMTDKPEDHSGFKSLPKDGPQGDTGWFGQPVCTEAYLHGKRTDVSKERDGATPWGDALVIATSLLIGALLFGAFVVNYFSY